MIITTIWDETECISEVDLTGALMESPWQPQDFFRMVIWGEIVYFIVPPPMLAPETKT